MSAPLNPPGRPKLTAREAEHRAEVIGAYTASVRLELYARLALLLSLLAFVAVLGATIVGWMDVDRGVVLLTWALLLAVATAAKIYDESTRTRLGAARMERGVATDEERIGSIETGKHADMIVLNHDLLEIPETEIVGTVVQQTILNGEVVYAA